MKKVFLSTVLVALLLVSCQSPSAVEIVESYIFNFELKKEQTFVQEFKYKNEFPQLVSKAWRSASPAVVENEKTLSKGFIAKSDSLIYMGVLVLDTAESELKLQSFLVFAGEVKNKEFMTYCHLYEDSLVLHYPYLLSLEQKQYFIEIIEYGCKEILNGTLEMY